MKSCQSTLTFSRIIQLQHMKKFLGLIIVATFISLKLNEVAKCIDHRFKLPT